MRGTGVVRTPGQALLFLAFLLVMIAVRMATWSTPTMPMGEPSAPAPAVQGSGDEPSGEVDARVRRERYHPGAYVPPPPPSTPWLPLFIMVGCLTGSVALTVVGVQRLRPPTPPA